jgi:MFS family permease
VSLATDAASEAIYPLLPYFLTTVLGAGAISLGLVEGTAEAANSVLKVASGRLSDRARARRPIVISGYSVSSLVRPLIAVAQSWMHVFAIRLIDRVGKGVRGAPRDAMLADWAEPATRGRIFGFHRGMDHAGAVLGPVLASAFLLFYPGEYRTLFALTIIPGAIAVGLIFFVPEEGRVVASGFGRIRQERPLVETPEGETPDAVSGFSRTIASPDVPLPPEFTRFMLVLTLFTLGNSTDAFLLLRLTEAAGSVAFIPLLWAALHIVKSTTSLVGGSWSDRVGRRRVIALGWIVYSVVYVGFAASSSISALIGWFLFYGLYFGLTEGTEKALVADLAPASRRGYAFGLYNAVLGIGALAASVLFGAIWQTFGPAAAFVTGAGIALLATALLVAMVRT